MTNETPAAPRKIETETCSRCGGTGHYSYNQITGTVCFKCSGGKVVYTKRGRAAADFLHALRCKPASEVKVGDKIQVEYFFKGVKAFAEVVRVGYQENGGGYYVDGVLKPYYMIEVNHPKYGSMGTGIIDLNQPIRVAMTAEQKLDTLRKALDFQDTLGKNGKPSKKALKAVQDAVAKEVLAENRDLHLGAAA